MSSKKSITLAFFLVLNLIFFTFTSACGTCTTPKRPNPSPSTPGGRTPGGGGQTPGSGTPGGRTPGGQTPGGGTPGGQTPGGGTPRGPSTTTCPRDALQLGVCADLLGGLINVVIGTPPVTPCCTLIQGLADLEAAVCLCTAIRANVLGINLNVPLSLSLILNVCSSRVPPGFQC